MQQTSICPQQMHTVMKQVYMVVQFDFNQWNDVRICAKQRSMILYLSFHKEHRLRWSYFLQTGKERQMVRHQLMRKPS